MKLGDLAYDVAGEGPTLVLVHAFPLDRTMWRATASSLSDRYRVVTIDVRGFGESVLRGPASLEDFADDLAAVLDALGAPMAAVGGLSMGGYIALAFAQRHGARLSALVLADTRAGADSPEARRTRDDGIATVHTRGVAALVDPMPERLLSPAAPTALRAALRTQMQRQSEEGVANALLAMRDRPDRTAELRNLACPTLIVCGCEDAITPPAEARAMAALIPDVVLHEISGAGHLSNLEQPAAFDGALAEFLDSVFVD